MTSTQSETRVAVYWSFLELPVQLLMEPDRGLRLDLVGSAGDAVKTELGPQQPARISGVRGTHLGLNDLCSPIDLHSYAGLECLHASI